MRHAAPDLAAAAAFVLSGVLLGDASAGPRLCSPDAHARLDAAGSVAGHFSESYWEARSKFRVAAMRAGVAWGNLKKARNEVQAAAIWGGGREIRQ